LLADDTLLVSSERDRENKPWIKRFALDLCSARSDPARFMPVTETGAGAAA
jgi:hypothetical protein